MPYIPLYKAALAMLLSAGAADSNWLCTEAASIRNGNILTVCGIGMGKTEAEARLMALKEAKKEFFEICEVSADCKGRNLRVTPLRNECLSGRDGYKCYRGVKFEIGKKLAKSQSQEAVLDEKLPVPPVRTVAEAPSPQPTVTPTPTPEPVAAETPANTSAKKHFLFLGPGFSGSTFQEPKYETVVAELGYERALHALFGVRLSVQYRHGNFKYANASAKLSGLGAVLAVPVYLPLPSETFRLSMQPRATLLQSSYDVSFSDGSSSRTKKTQWAVGGALSASLLFGAQRGWGIFADVGFDVYSAADAKGSTPFSTRGGFLLAF